MSDGTPHCWPVDDKVARNNDLSIGCGYAAWKITTDSVTARSAVTEEEYSGA